MKCAKYNIEWNFCYATLFLDKPSWILSKQDSRSLCSISLCINIYLYIRPMTWPHAYKDQYTNIATSIQTSSWLYETKTGTSINQACKHHSWKYHYLMQITHVGYMLCKKEEQIQPQCTIEADINQLLDKSDGFSSVWCIVFHSSHTMLFV